MVTSYKIDTDASQENLGFKSFTVSMTYFLNVIGDHLGFSFLILIFFNQLR